MKPNFNELTNNNLLDDLLLDYQAFKLSQVWNSQSYVWSRWLRK